MSGVYKVQVPENYRPLGVKKKGRFYFSRKTRKNPEKIFGDSYGGRRALASLAPWEFVEKN